MKKVVLSLMGVALTCSMVAGIEQSSIAAPGKKGTQKNQVQAKAKKPVAKKNQQSKPVAKAKVPTKKVVKQEAKQEAPESNIPPAPPQPTTVVKQQASQSNIVPAPSNVPTPPPLPAPKQEVPRQIIINVGEPVTATLTDAQRIKLGYTKPMYMVYGNGAEVSLEAMMKHLKTTLPGLEARRYTLQNSKVLVEFLMYLTGKCIYTEDRFAFQYGDKVAFTQSYQSDVKIGKDGLYTEPITVRFDGADYTTNDPQKLRKHYESCVNTIVQTQQNMPIISRPASVFVNSQIKSNVSINNEEVKQEKLEQKKQKKALKKKNRKNKK